MIRAASSGLPRTQGLYDPQREHDSCGVGFVLRLDGEPRHEIVQKGIEALTNMLHRGASGADKLTGDGAGLMLQVPHGFFTGVLSPRHIMLPESGDYGVGMFFLPRVEGARRKSVAIIERCIAAADLELLGWRAVPVAAEHLGEQARVSMPHICQVFIGGRGRQGDELERILYCTRRKIERAGADIGAANDIFYAVSLSCRTVIYKGLMNATQVPLFYPDLADPRVKSAIAVFHQRYSTNTFPSWELAQPFRLIGHNGEINTLRGNLTWMRSRERNLSSEIFGDEILNLLPVVAPGASDSAALDNVLELLVRGGRSIDHAASMLIPQAWGDKYPMGPDLRGFFEYHAGIMEPWDGPAAVVFCDGIRVGALMDRNGLRPGRYTLTDDGFMVFASETGVLEIAPERVTERGALRPGQIMIADISRGRLLKDTEIKTGLARRRPYRRWVEENQIDIHGFFQAANPVVPDQQRLFKRHLMFGYTREDIDMLLVPMAADGHEPVGSMGTDSPLAVLSERPQLLFNYFKQMFAQITNPAIDPIREELVMSLMTFIGNPDNILTEVPQHGKLIKLRHPILTNDDLSRLRGLNRPDFRSVTLPIGFTPGNGKALEQALEDLCRRAEEHLAEGNKLLVLSDRCIPETDAPIPILLAVSAVHHHLTRKSLRTSAGLLVETGEAREVMHMALLLGYGATAINPYLAFDTVADLARRGDYGISVGVVRGVENYVKALCKGLLKVMSKIGISTLRSYRNAQIFEAIGLSSKMVERHFTGTPSRIEGIGIEEIAGETLQRYRRANLLPSGSEDRVLPSGGHYSLRKDGERHLWTAESINALQQATRKDNPESYKAFAGMINDQERNLFTLRGLFRFRPAEAVPLDEVEPVESIMRRFVTGAMSFGSISREAHETLAIAMNRIGGMSNSGEGGEDPERYRPDPDGNNRCSMVKQIASGRFGVTAEYLVNAGELQIKIAQGAKPGEGGQLPGHKVNAEIAKVRHSTPGVSLISPPPHHDIYSIEDIAQLIYDLKNANETARVSVKLVSEVGIGTIAAGVAKAKADVILVSGFDGGTGASPLSSVRHAGAPWELGLAEVQQTLVLNDLRSRVRLQADGQMKTGRDVVVAALLGAEEYGFATAPLVVCGCVMMRKCHKNTCPVGVATQDPEMRKRYTGRPEYLVNYFHFVAGEVREYMARLGVRKLDDLIGRTDLLEVNTAIDFWKVRGLDMSRILNPPSADSQERRATLPQDHELDQALDRSLLPELREAIEKGVPTVLESPIRNIHRTVGTMISSAVTRRHGGAGLAEDTVTLRFHGAAGQSFGAFCTRGMTLLLEGEANDYLGKGLSGARIVLRPHPRSRYRPEENIIAGNVLLYGAIAGECFINGRVGERFAIRNSGATAVVEGVGDHGCEYMTGGCIVVLGETGVNFGAGMSGGIAYVYDPSGTFDVRCNLEMIDLDPVCRVDAERLREMIQRHHEYTGSRRARHILESWEECLPHFVKVFPMEYKRALGRMSREDFATQREEVVNV